jgi:hypothetical protein
MRHKCDRRYCSDFLLFHFLADLHIQLFLPSIELYIFATWETVITLLLYYGGYNSDSRRVLHSVLKFCERVAQKEFLYSKRLQMAQTYRTNCYYPAFHVAT